MNMDIATTSRKDHETTGQRMRDEATTQTGNETMTTIKEALKYQTEMIHGGNIDEAAQDWADAGFTSGEECEPWWAAGCFDADSTRQLIDAGVTPEIAAMVADQTDGYSYGYRYCNSDIQLSDVVTA